MPANPINIRFDFRHYIPSQDLSKSTIEFDQSICSQDSLAITVLANNLIPGRAYRTTYELINPVIEGNIFNPSVSVLNATDSSQNFVTSAKLPPNNTGNNYIIKATTVDATEGSNVQTSAQIEIVCSTAKVFSLEIVDPDLTPIPPDNIINIGNCDEPYPLVCLIKDAVQGKKYEYEFIGNPSAGILFENQYGSIFAGDINQNFNTKVALTGYPFAFVTAKAKEIHTGITKTSQAVLLQCYQTNLCDVVLPTGVDCAVDAPVFKQCTHRGLTTASISSLYGGKGFAVGDTLTTTGGGGYGAEIQVLSGGITEETFSSLSGGSGFKINDLMEVTGGGGSGGLIKLVSGGITNASIDYLTGCSNFKVNDLLTTIGGGGKDALIKITATGLNGSISAYSVINPGYGFTNIPSGIKPIKGSGFCANAAFNKNNFTIPCFGGITYDSLDIGGGSGYILGETFNINGAGGSGCQVEIIKGTLTNASITNLSGGSGYMVGDYLSTIGGDGSDVLIKITDTTTNGAVQQFDLINGGHSFLSSPTGLVTITGTGLGASASFNNNNYAITPKGGLTKSSISNFINTGTGYTVGTELLVIGGGGKEGLIEITSVDNGKVSNFVIKNLGSNYNSSPSVIDNTGTSISNQPIWDIDKYTNYSYVVNNAGCGYVSIPGSIISINGSGSGADFIFDSVKFTDYSYIVVNTGSGYTSSPTDLIVRGGSGAGFTATFNDHNFTIPCAGGITYDSVNNLIGKSIFILGEELIVDGGDGSGGRIKVTEINSSGAITSFVILNAGCDYSSVPNLKRLNGSFVDGVSFDPLDFTELAFIVTNPGTGFFEAATGLEVLTGNGSIESVYVAFNSDNFINIVGPEPSPSNTPTPTVTPSQSEPASCDDIQTAGGTNPNFITTVAEIANIGQNYIIVVDTEGLQKNAAVTGNGILEGTSVTKVENYFANFNDRIRYKKITLNQNITSQITIDTEVMFYSPDIRLIKVPYWRGEMTFTYDAYSIPDRFRVYAVPMNGADDILLYDTGYRGEADYVVGPGFGSVQIIKPDGCVLVKVVTEAPFDGTAWEYTLYCPNRIWTTLTSTPTRTPTLTPTPSHTSV